VRKYDITLLMILFLMVCACGQSAPTWQEQYDLGVRYLSEGNYEEAIIVFTAAIEINPKQAPAYVGRGDAYVGSGEAEEKLSLAQADYEKAIELDSTPPEAYLGLAEVYIQRGDYETALEILRKGLEKSGDNQAIADKILEIESISLETEEDSTEYFNNPLSWEEICFKGIQFENCTEEAILSAYPVDQLNGYPGVEEGLYGERSYWANLDILFSWLPNYDLFNMEYDRLGVEVAQWSGSISADCWSELEFRGIACGMNEQELYEALGMTTEGIALTESYNSIIFYVNDGACQRSNENYDFGTDMMEEKMICIIYGDIYGRDLADARRAITFWIKDGDLDKVTIDYRYK